MRKMILTHPAEPGDKQPKFYFSLEWDTAALSRSVTGKIEDACRALRDAADLYEREKGQADV